LDVKTELDPDLVCNLDEKAEPLAGAEVEPLGDVLAEVLGPRRGVHLERLNKSQERAYFFIRGRGFEGSL
jgi:hypothetical protein